jgi:preprotein translocase subunit SecA
MIQAFLQKIFGTSHERQLKKIQPRVNAINELEPKIKKLTDDELRARTATLKEKVGNGAKLDDVLIEAFAVCREGGRRALNMRHYDVQLIGGIVLHEGKIAEMKTGEGKTLVATLPCYLNALSGKGVHVVTVNDYLAKRDQEWMGKLYGFLGLTSGCVYPQQSDAEKRAAYRADITYGQNNEFGFDYLRDNMKFSIHEYAQRELNFAIVDEVDSILIDEARTPLIISGEGQPASKKYSQIAELMPKLRKDEHYVVDEKNHQVSLTDEGIELAQSMLYERKIIEVPNLFDLANLEAIHILQQSLRAHTLYKRDQHYLVSADQKVVIIDEFTGRTLAGRRWSDGLHQAIEAKERVPIQSESRTLATISFQNYFRLYKKLAGMTGTADTEAPEFLKIYNLEVVVIPTNKPIQRKDYDDLVYKTEREKFKAVFEHIMECTAAGQPVLVGTTSVEKSEALSKMLDKKGIPYNLLNAKQHEREAYIVAQAGRKGAITIATNMAGRGTDILLGGNPEMLGRMEVLEAARAELASMGDGYRGPSSLPEGMPIPLIDDKERFDAAVKEAQKKYEEICAKERQEVLAAGGLQIIGTERHESRRIDNQLRGRAGRQGDPGASRFYLSLEDDLMRIFGGDRIQGMMATLGMEEGVPIEHPWVTKSVENAQKKVEERNFDIRKNLLEYDDVMNQQRKSVYTLRRQVLEGQYRTVPTDEEAKKGKEPERVVSKPRPEYLEQVRPVVAQMIRFHGGPPQPAPDAPPDVREAWLKFVRGGDLAEVAEVRVAPFERNVYEAFGCRISIEKLAKDPKKLLEFCVQEISLSLTEQDERLLDLVEHLVVRMVEKHCPSNKHPQDWDIAGLARRYKEVFGIEANTKSGDPTELAHRLYHDAEAVLDKKEAEIGPDFLRMFRNFYLREIDRQWLEHLTTMEQLRDGIGLRGYGQRDPKKEYKKEGYDLFVSMTESCKEAVCKNMFAIEVVREDDIRRIEEARRREAEAQLGRLRMQHAGAPGQQDPQGHPMGGRVVRPQAGLTPAQAAALAAAARARGRFARPIRAQRGAGFARGHEPRADRGAPGGRRARCCATRARGGERAGHRRAHTGRGAGRACNGGGEPVAGRGQAGTDPPRAAQARPKRPVLVWQRQEVQELPHASGSGGGLGRLTSLPVYGGAGQGMAGSPGWSSTRPLAGLVSRRSPERSGEIPGAPGRSGSVSD